MDCRHNTDADTSVEHKIAQRIRQKLHYAQERYNAVPDALCITCSSWLSPSQYSKVTPCTQHPNVKLSHLQLDVSA